MGYQEFTYKISKHSEKFYKSHNFKFYGIEMTPEGLAVSLSIKIIKRSPYLKVKMT